MLNINHKILFYQKKFKSEVIDSFYRQLCSRRNSNSVSNVIKLLNLETYLNSKDLKADALITGHYVKRIKNNEKGKHV